MPFRVEPVTSSSGENKQYHMVCAWSKNVFQIKRHEYSQFTRYRNRVTSQKYCINIFACGLLSSPIKMGEYLVLIIFWQSLAILSVNALLIYI